jgi:hypothetical protein
VACDKAHRHSLQSALQPFSHVAEVVCDCGETMTPPPPTYPRCNPIDKLLRSAVYFAAWLTNATLREHESLQADIRLAVRCFGDSNEIGSFFNRNGCQLWFKRC